MKRRSIFSNLSTLNEFSVPSNSLFYIIVIMKTIIYANCVLKTVEIEKS